MSHSNGPLSGPDFGEGFDLSRLDEGTPVLGHKDGEQILLSRLDGQISEPVLRWPRSFVG